MRTPLRGLGPPGDDREVRDLFTGDSDRYAMWDAAYVLGSLSAADRREFEAHMAQCLDCRDAVAELSGVPALLSQLGREEVASINESGPTSALFSAPEMSPEVLTSLLAAVRFRRRRSRMTTWAASAAAAVVLGLGVLVGVQGHSTTAPLTSQHWGTFINMQCVCLAPPDAHHDTLAMVVVGRDGSKTRLATWVAEPG